MSLLITNFKKVRGVYLAAVFSAFWSLGAVFVQASPTPFSYLAFKELCLFSTRGLVGFYTEGITDWAALSQGRLAGMDIHFSLSSRSIPEKILVKERIIQLVAADLDHDGDTDLIAVTQTPRVLVWLNDGRGHFSPQPLPPAEEPHQSLLERGLTPEFPFFLWLQPHRFTASLDLLIQYLSVLELPRFCFNSYSSFSSRAPPPLHPLLFWNSAGVFLIT